jgi:hypothetical protein
VSLCNLALNCYPDRLDYVDKVLNYAKDKTSEFDNRYSLPTYVVLILTSPDLHSPSTQNNFLALLLAPISSYSNLLTILALPYYLPLLHAQTYATRRAVAAAVSHAILEISTPISTPDDVAGVLSLVRVLIKEGQPPNSMPGGRAVGAESDETIEEQGWLARMVHLFTDKESAEVDFEILKAVREAYWEAPGERCKYTSGSIVTAAVKIVRRFKAREHLVPIPFRNVQVGARILTPEFAGQRLGEQDYCDIQIYPPNHIALSPRRPNTRRNSPTTKPLRRPNRRFRHLSKSNVRFPRTSIQHLRRSNHRLAFAVF